MGTRGLTIVHNEDGKKMLNMYRQFDSYPSGHGAELASFLNSSMMVNGYSDKNAPQFNGMGCMAAQMVAHFKDGVGGFYIYPVSSMDCGQDYEYHVYKDKVIVKEAGWGKHRAKKLFEGSWKDFQTFCNSQE